MPASGVMLEPAIVVGSIRYGDTSRVVRLLTPGWGLISALARGASRPRSPFAGSLGLLSEGTAHLIPRRGDLQLVTAFDLGDGHEAVAGNMVTYLAGNAMAEILGRAAPAAGNPELYREVRHGVKLLAATPVEAAEAVALLVLWRVVSALGFAPGLDRCVRDGALLPPGPAVISLRDGGLICADCAAAVPGPRLPAEDREALVAFVQGEAELPDLDPPRAAAHRRLLARWLAVHLGEPELRTTAIWQRGG